MERRRLFAVVAQLVITAALVAAMAAFALSQTPEQAGSAKESALDSAKQARSAMMREMRELSKARKDTITGWLIVDGEYIPGPYDVEVAQEDSSILVNGIVVTSPAPQPEPIAVDPKYGAQHRFSTEQNIGYDSVYQEKGEAAAKRWVYEFTRNHPLIDTVFYSRGGI
jgi:hypothetical protein